MLSEFGRYHMLDLSALSTLEASLHLFLHRHEILHADSFCWSLLLFQVVLMSSLNHSRTLPFRWLISDLGIHILWSDKLRVLRPSQDFLLKRSQDFFSVMGATMVSCLLAFSGGVSFQLLCIPSNSGSISCSLTSIIKAFSIDLRQEAAFFSEG
jgi:hypothetical protein